MHEMVLYELLLPSNTSFILKHPEIENILPKLDSAELPKANGSTAARVSASLG